MVCIAGILLGHNLTSVDGFNSQFDKLKMLQDALQSVCIYVVIEFGLSRLMVVSHAANAAERACYNKRKYKEKFAILRSIRTIVTKSKKRRVIIYAPVDILVFPNSWLDEMTMIISASV